MDISCHINFSYIDFYETFNSRTCNKFTWNMYSINVLVTYHKFTGNMWQMQASHIIMLSVAPGKAHTLPTVIGYRKFQRQIGRVSNATDNFLYFSFCSDTSEGCTSARDNLGSTAAAKVLQVPDSSLLITCMHSFHCATCSIYNLTSQDNINLEINPCHLPYWLYYIFDTCILCANMMLLCTVV